MWKNAIALFVLMQRKTHTRTHTNMGLHGIEMKIRSVVHANCELEKFLVRGAKKNKITQMQQWKYNSVFHIFTQCNSNEFVSNTGRVRYDGFVVNSLD